MAKKLSRDFFNRNTVIVARELIGKVISWESPFGKIVGVITETEAYTEDEESCHAFIGKTPRNEVMFRDAGHFYVYFIYGMHYCANIVTEEEGRGCAVLLRSVKPIEGLNLIRENRSKAKEKDWCNGPSKLCQAFGWTKEQNGIYIPSSDLLSIEDHGLSVKKNLETPRIGISKAKDLLWRFTAELK